MHLVCVCALSFARRNLFSCFKAARLFLGYKDEIWYNHSKTLTARKVLLRSVSLEKHDIMSSSLVASRCWRRKQAKPHRFKNGRMQESTLYTIQQFCQWQKEQAEDKRAFIVLSNNLHTTYTNNKNSTNNLHTVNSCIFRFTYIVKN